LNHRILLPALLLLLSACASSEDSSTSGPDWVPGIYTGNFTANGGTPQPSVVMITSNNKALFTEDDVGSVGLGTVSGDTVSFGAQASMSLTQDLTGNFNFAGTVGSFSLVASTLYNQGSALSLLHGNYVDDTYTAFAGDTSWVFDQGDFDLTSNTSCIASGSVAPINISYNEYTVSMTIENCPGYNGSYTGLAFTDTNSAGRDTINILVENATRDTLIFSAPVQQ
jgi:hypothetical protein